MKIRSRLVMTAVAGLFAGLMRALFCTLSLRIREVEPGTNLHSPAPGKKFLYAVWHDSAAIPAFAGRVRGASVLISRSLDGSLVNELLRWIGVNAVRGSTKRLSPSAFRDLIAAIENGCLVITPDGPRGPARRVSVGIVYLASRTATPIVPMAYLATSAWRFAGNWTTLVIPRPFSRVELVAGQPIVVPPDLSRPQLAEYVARVQEEMDRLHQGETPSAHADQQAPMASQ